MYVFYLYHVSIGENGLMTSSQLLCWGFSIVLDLSMFFIILESSVLSTYIGRIIISSCYIVLSMTLKQHSLSLLTCLGLKSISVNNKLAM